MVAGRTVSVTANTQINQDAGPVAVGVLVKVEGYRLADGTVRAQEIEVKHAGNGQPNEGAVHLVGQVEARPDGTLLGTWTIAGRTVEVVTATVFDESHGPAALGVRVKVEGTEQADGSVLAAQIKTLGNGAGRRQWRRQLRQVPRHRSRHPRHAGPGGPMANPGQRRCHAHHQRPGRDLYGRDRWPHRRG